MDEKAKQKIKEKIHREFAESLINRILKGEPVLYYRPEHSDWLIRTDGGGSFNCFSFGEALHEFASHGIRRIEMEFDGFGLEAAAVSLTKKEAVAINAFLSEHWATFARKLESEGLFSADDIDEIGRKFSIAERSA